MDEVLGLPAHPLLVHAPVVLIPLAFAGSVLAVVWRRHRRVLLVVVAGFALAGGVMAYLAAGAGESLEDRLEDGGALTEPEEERVEDHETAGQRAEWASVAFAVVAVVAGGAAAVGGDRRSRSPVVPVLAVLSLVAGGVATTAVVLAGHSGATAVWEDDGPAADRDGGDDDSDDRGPGGDKSGPG
jgi:uncharacterized membrane protein